jgi:hypothetical protein
MGGIGGLLGIASMGVLAVLGVGLIVVGLGTVKRVHALAGFALAGAGGLMAFAAVVRQIMSFALSFTGIGTLYTLSTLFTTGMHILAAVLLPVSIFLLTNAVKQGGGQVPPGGPRIHY